MRSARVAKGANDVLRLGHAPPSGHPGGTVCGCSAGFGQKTHCDAMQCGEPSAGHEQTFAPCGIVESFASYAAWLDALIAALGQMQLYPEQMLPDATDTQSGSAVHDVSNCEGSRSMQVDPSFEVPPSEPTVCPPHAATRRKANSIKRMLATMPRELDARTRSLEADVMNACLSFALVPMVLVCACSGGGSGNDAGTDASPTNDAANDVATKDGASDAQGDAGGCGATTGTATVTGTLLGNTLTALDAVSNPGGGTPFVVITSWANVCSLGLNSIKKNGSGLLFDFLNTPTVTVGTFPVGANLDVQYATYDATCSSPTGESSTGGSVTITKADSCGIQGTFDVTLNNDHVTGSFNAPNCDNGADAGQSCVN